MALCVDEVDRVDVVGKVDEDDEVNKGESFFKTNDCLIIKK